MSKMPYFIAGSGDLVAHVRREKNELDAQPYSFNLFRISHDGEATSWLQPGDLRGIVKTCQVLAFSIADDGWVDNSLRAELTELARDLQDIADAWRDNDGTL